MTSPSPLQRTGLAKPLSPQGQSLGLRPAQPASTWAQDQAHFSPRTGLPQSASARGWGAAAGALLGFLAGLYLRAPQLALTSLAGALAGVALGPFAAIQAAGGLATGAVLGSGLASLVGLPAAPVMMAGAAAGAVAMGVMGWRYQGRRAARQAP